MNAMFNQVDFIHRLEREGLARGAAETIATGIDEGRRELATKADLDTAKNDLERLIALSIARQTTQFGAMLAAGLGLAVAILGTILALK